MYRFGRNKFIPKNLPSGFAGYAVTKAEAAGKLIEPADYKPIGDSGIEILSVHLNAFYADPDHDREDPRYCVWSDRTPIVVYEINGQPIDDRFAMKFPNPGASIMAEKFPEWETEFCNKVIIYMDTNNAPALMLFPQNYTYFYSLKETQYVCMDPQDPKYILVKTQAALDDLGRLAPETQQAFLQQVRTNQPYINSVLHKRR